MTDYPPGMTLRPIDTWPGQPTPNRRRAPFRSTLTTTLGDLRQELHALGDGGPRSWYNRTAYPPSILQLGLRERDIRMDGMPRADAKVTHPGIILNVTPPGRAEMSFPCDTFEDWQDNLRAVTLTLKALRQIDRYGVTQTGQQYRGWQAIEAAPATNALSGARSLIARTAYPDDTPARQAAFADQMATSSVVASTTLRRAKRNSHPDRNAGDRTTWNQVEQAAALLGIGD